MKRNIRVLSVVLATVMLLTSLMSCSSCQSGNNNGTVIDNENTRLVLSTSELDGVFNPFYSSSAPDLHAVLRQER